MDANNIPSLEEAEYDPETQAQRNRWFEERSQTILDLIGMGASSDLVNVELATMIVDGLGLEKQSPAEILKIMRGEGNSPAQGQSLPVTPEAPVVPPPARRR